MRPKTNAIIYTKCFYYCYYKHHYHGANACGTICLFFLISYLSYLCNGIYLHLHVQNKNINHSFS